MNTLAHDPDQVIARRSRNKYGGLFLAIALVFMSFVAYQVWTSLNTAKAAAVTNAQNLSLILESKLNTEFSSAERIVTAMAGQLEPNAMRMENAARYRPQVSRWLKDNVNAISSALALRYFDSRGNRLYSSRDNEPDFNIADRAFFRQLKNGAGNTILYSEVTIGRISRRPNLFVVKPLRNPEGSFLGAAIAVIDLTSLRELLQAIDLGSQGVVSVRRVDNGSLLVGSPNPVAVNNEPAPNLPVLQAIHKSATNGTIENLSPLDHVARIYGFRVIGASPLFVVVGIAKADYLAEWRQQSLLSSIAAFALLAIMAGVFYRLAVSDSRRSVSERQLHESEVQLGGILGSTEDGILAIDGNGKVLRTNRKFAELWRIPQAVLDSGDDQTLLSFVLGHLADPGDFLKTVQALYESDAQSTDSVHFNDGRVFERFSAPLILNGTKVGRVWSFRDVTERRRVEHRLGLAIEVTRVVLWEYDFLDDRLIFDHDQLRALELDADFAPQTLSAWIEGIHPGDKAEFAERVSHAAQSGNTVFDMEYRMTGKATPEQWIHTRGSVVRRDARGRAALAVGTSMNITARKRAEEAKRVSETQSRELAAMLRLMCDNVPDMIWAKDLEKRYLFANKAICEQLLNAKDTIEPLGRTDMFFARREREREPGNPDWHTFGELCQDSDAITLSRDEESQFEEFGNVKGKLLYLDVHKAPFRDHHGKVIGTVGCGRDVTERKRVEFALQESEERFRNIANTAPVFVWMIDSSMQCNWVNQRWLDFTGRRIEDELGQGWADRMHPDDRRSFLDSFAVAFGKRERFSLEYRYRRCDGAYRQMADEGVPRFTAEGIFDGYVGICLDITDRKEAETALIEAREAAELANHAKSTFLANMSHEIRTPLNGVLGNLQLLELSGLNAEQKQYLSAVTISGNNLLSLISDILDLSKVEADKIVLENEVFSLRSCISVITRMQSARASASGLFLNVQIGDEVPDTLTGDELRLRQILSNLLSNAIKFTQHGGVTLSVVLRERKDGIAHIEFEMADTGIGVPGALTESIFNPFVQAESSIARRYGGTGLGLAICRRLVTLMQGSISVTSTEGKGSTFRVLLPFAISTAAGLPAEASAPALMDLRAGPVLNVLLAEDNDISREFGVSVLRKLGHQVTAVENGQNALAALENEKFDLVLMDIQMPVMDGRRAAAMLRNREIDTGRHVAVIAVTAYASKEDELELLAAGFDGFVGKPLAINRLIEEIRRVLKLDGALPSTADTLPS